MRNAWNFLDGKKTYIVGTAAVIYGVYKKDIDAIWVGLGLLGLRNAIPNEKQVIEDVVNPTTK